MPQFGLRSHPPPHTTTLNNVQQWADFFSVLPPLVKALREAIKWKNLPPTPLWTMSNYEQILFGIWSPPTPFSRKSQNLSKEVPQKFWTLVRPSPQQPKFPNTNNNKRLLEKFGFGHDPPPPLKFFLNQWSFFCDGFHYVTLISWSIDGCIDCSRRITPVKSRSNLVRLSLRFTEICSLLTLEQLWASNVHSFNTKSIFSSHCENCKKLHREHPLLVEVSSCLY